MTTPTHTDTALLDAPQTTTQDQSKTKQPWLWHVVLLDDNAHTYDYVVLMMQSLFAKPLESAFHVAKTVDAQGRAIVLTTHKEHAELKRDQILAFGKDPLIASCKGSMSAIIEPAYDDEADDSSDADIA